MGKFSNDITVKQRKHKQRVTVPIVFDEEYLDDAERVIEALPDTYTGNVTDISASSGLVTVDVAYTARGANVTDVKRRLTDGGLPYASKRPKTERLCACQSGPCTED